MNIIIADNQDITRAGWIYILQSIKMDETIVEVENKKDLILALEKSANSLVIVDYTLFDFDGIQDLYHVHERFRNSSWILCSSELSDDFLRQIIYAPYNYSVLLKDSSVDEFRICLKQATKGSRYISNSISNAMLESSRNNATVERSILTQTETEILKDISLGKSTKEIASLRHISIHTVMTHRKNIFRKLEVNNVLEATKYAMRAGIVDLSEYYI